MSSGHQQLREAYKSTKLEELEAKKSKLASVLDFISRMVALVTAATFDYFVRRQARPLQDSSRVAADEPGVAVMESRERFGVQVSSECETTASSRTFADRVLPNAYLFDKNQQLQANNTELHVEIGQMSEKYQSQVDEYKCKYENLGTLFKGDMDAAQDARYKRELEKERGEAFERLVTIQELDEKYSLERVLADDYKLSVPTARLQSRVIDSSDEDIDSN